MSLSDLYSDSEVIGNMAHFWWFPHQKFGRGGILGFGTGRNSIDLQRAVARPLPKRK